MSKPGRTRGGRVEIANMGAKAKSGSRHLRRAVEKAKLKDLKKALRDKGIIK